MPPQRVRIAKGARANACLPCAPQRRSRRSRSMTEWRYPSLEGLRFLASLAIVVYHFVPYTERGLAAPEFWSGQFSVAVDLFFVISGIVIANGYLGRTSTWREYGEFMRRRFARLYPLHVATLGFYVLVG